MLCRVLHKNGYFIWIEGTATNLLEEESVKAIIVNFHDVNQRIEAGETLKKYAEDLKNSNTELERFAYVASHDLQEPLRMISSFMNLLTKRIDQHLDETTRQYIHFAVDGAERMKTLIQALLQYSRVGTTKENFAPVDLNEVMQYVRRLLEEDINKNKAIITVNPMPVITANKPLINQLFANLVSNAVKYHGDKTTEVEVGYTEKGDQWTFYVKDNGIGIDTRFFDKIFVIFQRLHNKTEHSGTGIGLAICKKIVEIHKGKIWVESEAGKGSIFYFSLPKKYTI
jgi:light-regulated signal transduction histidine kinase (bacteriophytochrome)